MTQRPTYFPLGGGLDLVTPPVRRNPGRAIGGYNYEPRPEGYRRIDGYERYDGRALASAASYSLLPFDTGSAAVAAGQVVTGATSGATGEALVDAVVESGGYGGSNAAGYLVLTGITGTFQDGEALQVSGVTKALADGTATDRGADNDTDDATWLRDAIETQRAKIGAVPGSGAIRGVAQLGSTLYAWRDNAGATACALHKATASGWQTVSLGRQLAFTSGGTYEIQEGDVITGATSGATATVTRVATQDGDWAAGDAAGRLIFASQTGTFQAEDLNVGANSNVATIGGNSSAITLLPGGRYEVVAHNFTGFSGDRRLYGCDGVNPAFEFDGTVFAPVVTGMDTDAPTHVAAHQGHLWLSFPGGSVQRSGIGAPFNWEVLTGAGEFGMGDEVTGLLSGFAGILVVFARNRLGIMYGTDFVSADSDAALKIVSEEAGAIEWSVQHLTQPVFLDDRGVRALASVDTYGDFSVGALSAMVKPWLDRKRAAGATVAASLRVRDRSQYRLFFSDGSGLVLDQSGAAPAFMPLDLGMVIRCAVSVEDADGTERLYAGSDDGYVYRLDSGTSFDGGELTAVLRLPFNHLGSPGIDKRYHSATMEVTTAPNATLYVTADYSYGSPDLPSSTEQSFDVSGSGGFWNEAAWNEFYWSSEIEGRARADLDGIGANISLSVATEATYEAPHTLHGCTMFTTQRRVAR